MTTTPATHERIEDEDDDRVEASPRAFGLLFAAVFAVIAFAPMWRGAPVRLWSVGLSVAFVATALLAPRLLQPLSRVWQRVGLLLHHIVNPVITGILFYAVLTPFGLVVRLFRGGLAAQLTPDEQASTYWRSRADSPWSNMRNQF